jgi:hypothetical protein
MLLIARGILCLSDSRMRRSHMSAVAEYMTHHEPHL